MKIVSLSEEYLNYLREFDSKVCLTKLETSFGRKYVGVIFNIKDLNYFAPLSSPKPNKKKHFTDFYIKNGELGSIKLNNMVPIPMNCKNLVSEVYVNEFLNSNKYSDRKYGTLLQNQLFFIDSDHVTKLISVKAKQIYELKTGNRDKFNLCCDFKLLEQKALEYSQILSLSQTKENSRGR